MTKIIFFILVNFILINQSWQQNCAGDLNITFNNGVMVCKCCIRGVCTDCYTTVKPTTSITKASTPIITNTLTSTTRSTTRSTTLSVTPIATTTKPSVESYRKNCSEIVCNQYCKQPQNPDFYRCSLMCSFYQLANDEGECVDWKLKCQINNIITNYTDRLCDLYTLPTTATAISTSQSFGNDSMSFKFEIWSGVIKNTFFLAISFLLKYLRILCDLNHKILILNFVF